MTQFRQKLVLCPQIFTHFTLVKWGYIAGNEICTAEGCRTYPLAITRTVLETG